MHERRENVFVFALGLFVSGIKLFALFWVFSSCVIFGFLSPPQIPFRTMSTCYYFSSFLGKGRGEKEGGVWFYLYFGQPRKQLHKKRIHTYTYRNYPLATTDVKENPRDGESWLLEHLGDFLSHAAPDKLRLLKLTPTLGSRTSLQPSFGATLCYHLLAQNLGKTALFLGHPARGP